MSFFTFVKRYTDLGVGTRDLGLQRRTTIPAGGSFMGGTGARKWNVQRQLGPLNSPGYMMLNKALVPVSIRGSGISIGGQFVTQNLVKGGKGQ